MVISELKVPEIEISVPGWTNKVPTHVFIRLIFVMFGDARKVLNVEFLYSDWVGIFGTCTIVFTFDPKSNAGMCCSQSTDGVNI
jgi:hypothetical protein